MRKSRLWRAFTVLLALAMLIPAGGVFAADDTGGDDTFYEQLAALVKTQDDSAYFNSMELTIGSKTLSVDGEDQTMDVVPELISSGFTMLPIRAVAEAAGAKVAWDDATRKVTITGAAGDKVVLTIGSDTMTVNGKAQELEVTPYIKGERTFLPLRAVTEALEMDVDWVQETRTVLLSAPYQTCRLVAFADTLNTAGLKADKVINDGAGFWVLQFSTPSLAKEALETLQSRGVQAEPDHYIPPVDDQNGSSSGVESSSHYSWGVENAGFDTFIQKYSSGMTGSGTVAVVDTGVSASHSMLSGRVLSGRDFVDGDNNADDGHYHGTHVAGTIIDCVGSTSVKILPVRVLNSSGAGYDSWIVSGVKYAADQGADVINLSLGGDRGSSSTDSMDTAISYAVGKGAIVAIAAGNESRNTSLACPAHLTTAGTLIVSAGNSSHNIASFSNYGSNIDLMGPGVDIRSAAPGNTYKTLSGTSMATPHVAAAAMLLDLATGKKLTPSALEDLVHTASSNGKWTNTQLGYGWLDMRKADVPAPNPAPSLVSYEFSAASMKLDVGKTGKLTVNEVYSDGSKKDITSTAGLKSSNTAVATVASDGTVTGKASGTATISMTNPSGSVSAPAPVTVTVGSSEIVKYEFNTSSLELSVGETKEIKVYAVYADGQKSDVTSSAGLTSSNSTIAKVGNDGKVTGVAEGKAVISMTIAGDSVGVPAPLNVTVTDDDEIGLVSYEFNIDKLDLITNTTAKIQVFAVYSDGSRKDVTSGAALKSSKTSVATVAADGTVTGVSAGSATITMGYTPDKTVKLPTPLEVTVREDKMTKIYWAVGNNVNSAEELDEDDGLTLSASSDAVYVKLIGETESGSKIDLTGVCKPYSMDESIVVCDSTTGKLTFVGRGSTYLYFREIPNTNLTMPSVLGVTVH